MTPKLNILNVNRFLLVLPVVAFPVIVPGAAGVSLGVAPSSLNLGEVERGETASGTIFLTVNDLEQRFLVRPAYQSVSADTYELDLADNYTVESANVNNFGSWMSFPSSGDVVDPGTSEAVGGTLFESEVPFEVRVPEDAEPGWYVASIRLNPQISQDVSGTGVSLRAITRPTIIFRVPGEVRREVEVVDSRGFRTGTSSGAARLTVRNTGTVSVYLDPENVGVVDPTGSNFDPPTGGETRIEPGETESVTVGWDGQGEIPAGNYQVQGAYNHLTGAMFVDQTVQITDFVQDVQISEPEGNQTGPLGETGGDNTWIIVFLLVVLGVLLYSFDIDPVWILSITGLLGITALVLTTGLPTWVLGLTVVGLIALLYIL